ncbi:MAG: stage V sporulation protein R [Epulopiscium sp. Nele67-Bin005]|nr:MAG: stage V sporulation protein R [Epulopiscium sp. Nele67-Bin005]
MYTVDELFTYSEQIEELTQNLGFNCYPQHFELVDYEDMICYATYSGMPSHYPHWSLGKIYEKLKTLYNYNLSGIPYEMVINSNPCIAYLIKDNSLTMQILTMAHVYGHNDFFANNQYFTQNTDASLSISMFKNHTKRIRSYIYAPSIGYEKVEKFLDAVHSIKYQCTLNQSEKDLPIFLRNWANLEEWQKDILDIVIKQNVYFLPQIETKIINEGWASFWHYYILNNLNLTMDKMFEFFKIHNNIVRPTINLNPYFLGYKIWRDVYINCDGNIEQMLAIREIHKDSSFIRNYLSYEVCDSANLYSYKNQDRNYVIGDVSNKNNWQIIREQLANNVGINAVPHIEVIDFTKDTLNLYHAWDNKELDLLYTTETLKHIQTIWGGKITLKTQFSGIKRKIVCDSDKKVFIQNEEYS